MLVELLSLAYVAMAVIGIPETTEHSCNYHASAKLPVTFLARSRRAVNPKLYRSTRNRLSPRDTTPEFFMLALERYTDIKCCIQNVRQALALF